MELRQYCLIIRRWWRLIVACTVLGAGAALGVSTQMTPMYEASATLLVHHVRTSGDGSDYQDILTSERLARTYSKMLTGRPIMEHAAEQLDLDRRPGDLAERVKVELVPDTQLIRLKVEHTDPKMAAQVANAVAAGFLSYTETLQQDRYAESLGSLQRQIDELARLIQETETEIDELGPPGKTEEVPAEARLEGILAAYRATYSALVHQYEAMRVTAARTTDNVILFEEAETPRNSIHPHAIRSIMLAAVTATSMIGVGLGFLIEYLDGSLRSPEDVSEVATGLRTMEAKGCSRAERAGDASRTALAGVREAAKAADERGVPGCRWTAADGDGGEPRACREGEPGRDQPGRCRGAGRTSNGADRG